ncbi:MAG TPA: GNAT family N-acetyltransferase [Herpetosiphonaceae bacterium]
MHVRHDIGVGAALPPGLWMTTDCQAMDDAAIARMLYRAHWPPAVGRRLAAERLEGGLCFGLCLERQQIGFARAAAAKAGLAVISDVVIAHAWRGAGIGSWFLTQILSHPALLPTPRIAVVTATQQAFYGRLGFVAEPADATQTLLIFHRPAPHAPAP